MDRGDIGPGNGQRTPGQVPEYLREGLSPDNYQHNLIAQALNEYFLDHYEDHPVRYRDLPRVQEARRQAE